MHRILSVLLLVALQACMKDTTVKPQQGPLSTCWGADIKTVRASLLRPKNLSRFQGGGMLAQRELRDASGAPLAIASRSIDGLTVQEAAKLIEQPGHCYYTLVTYTNLSTGESWQEIEDYHCAPSSGGGGDGGGAGSGGSIGPSVTPSSSQPGNEDPCSTFRNLLSNGDYISLLKYVLNNLKNSPNEVGYTFSIDPATGNIRAVSNVGTPANVDIGYSSSSYTLSTVDGYMHSHTAADFPIFSIADLLSIYNMYSTGYISDPSTSTAGVWTPTGVYSLTISNPNAFLVFGAGLQPHRAQWEDTYTKTYHIKPSTSAYEAQKSFARMLATSNSGLTLSRLSYPAGMLTDPSSTVQGIQWETLSVNKSTLTAMPCPGQ